MTYDVRAANNDLAAAMERQRRRATLEGDSLARCYGEGRGVDPQCRHGLWSCRGTIRHSGIKRSKAAHDNGALRIAVFEDEDHTPTDVARGDGNAG